ncbi:hypothetical protein [Methylorubrum aminovorans]
MLDRFEQVLAIQVEINTLVLEILSAVLVDRDFSIKWIARNDEYGLNAEDG